MMNCYKKYKKSKNPNDKMRKNKNNKRVIVGLSGGIDSSVALILLKKQGYQPIGVSLKFSTWPNQENLSRKNLCRSQDPFHLVRKLCQNLKVPYHLIDCQKEFEKIVIKYFIKEWKNGRTPNPCIICNQKLKFPKLFELAKRFQAGCVATGHYARLRRGPSISNYQVSNKSHGSNIQLLKATDENKDQSYFLYTLKQNQLAKLIFPLGNITKDKVRKIAEKEKICYLKRESQDFCFLVNQSLFDFLKIKIGQRPGPIYNTNGQPLGTHQGLHFYTFGQRKGLSLGRRYWVCGFEKRNNALIVTNNENDPVLFRKEIYLKNFNFLSGKPIKKPIEVLAKCRYRQELSQAILFPPKNKLLKIIFKKPQKAVTPGQSCVFYLKDVCLGGGVIQ